MYEPDSYEEMMMAAYAGNGCLTCGASTHTEDNCSWEAAIGADFKGGFATDNTPEGQELILDRAYGLPRVVFRGSIGGPYMDHKIREIELASEARHGGNEYRDHLTRLGSSTNDENVRYWAKSIAEGLYQAKGYDGIMHDFRHRTLLPEAAFDWPIYKAAARLEILGHTGLEYDEE